MPNSLRRPVRWCMASWRLWIGSWPLPKTQLLTMVRVPLDVEDPEKWLTCRIFEENGKKVKKVEIDYFKLLPVWWR